MRFRIHQMFPAPGYRVFCCAINSETEPWFSEIPVIGWAIMRSVESASADPKHYTNDELELFVFEDGYAQPLSEFDGSNTETCILPPGEEFTEESKAQLAKQTRDRIRYREAHEKKLERVRELHSQGMSHQKIAEHTGLGPSVVSDAIRQYISRGAK
jgi:hypothetical protein